MFHIAIGGIHEGSTVEVPEMVVNKAGYFSHGVSLRGAGKA
jgi:hypothetical protein